MTDRELLQQALDAIKHLCLHSAAIKGYDGEQVQTAIDVLKARLAQPEPEPVAYLCENAVGHKYFRWKKPQSIFKPIGLYTAPPQCEPVPIAKLRELLEIHGRPGNWDQGPYMLGVYNGMEVMLSTVENRDPVFRERPKKEQNGG